VRFHVEVAAFEAGGDFQDRDVLDRWLESRPWVDGGGVRIARVATPYVTRLLGAIEARAHGYDAGTSGLQPRRVVGENGVPLRASIARALGVDGDGSLRAVADRIANVLEQGTPTLLLTEPSDPEQLGVVVAEAEEINELLVKGRNMTVAHLLLCTSARNAPRSVFDLSTGLPRVNVTAIDDDLERWRAYVHLRLAWECAGSLADTLTSAASVESIRPKQEGNL